MIRSFYFFFNAALSIIYSFLPVYLKSLGYTGTQVANIMVIDSVIGLLGISIFWGWISDHTQKPALMLKILAFGTAISFFPILTGQYYLIFVGYVIFGLFSNPIGGLADVMAIDTAKKKGVDFGKIRLWASLGWLSATFAVGFVLAAMGSEIEFNKFSDILLLLEEMLTGKNMNWNNPVVIKLIIGGFALTFISALTFRAVKVSQKTNTTKPKFSDLSLIFKNSHFLIFLLVVVFHFICLRSFFFIFGIHVQSLSLSPTILSIAFSIGIVAEIIAFYFFGQIRKYLKLEIILGVALFASMARWVIIANTVSPIVLVAVQVLHAASSGLFIAAAVSLVAEIAEAKLLATYQQVYNYAMTIGNFAGTYISAISFDYYKSATPVFYSLGVFELLGLGGIIFLLYLKKKVAIQTPPIGTT